MAEQAIARDAPGHVLQGLACTVSRSDRAAYLVTVDTPPSDRFREIFREWAASVALVAVRDDGRAYATTVTSLTPVSADPPTVLVSLGGNAQVLPFLDPGARFAVSLLARDQGLIAEVHADSYPVGPSPFATEGDPIVEGAQGWLVCEVDELLETRVGARLVLGRMLDGAVDPARAPLLYRRRGYLGVESEEG